MSKPKISKGEQTRQAILDVAAAIASAEGLEGLTIGRLAKELEMSKSGLFAHFGSKEDLQLATVDHAYDGFTETVFLPALKAPRGIRRLRELVRLWFKYATTTFPGGCFFVAAAAEFDSRPGPVRDAVARSWRDWLSTLEKAIRKAQEQGELDPSVDPGRLAYELNALATSSNTYSQLLGSEQIRVDAQQMVHDRIEQLAKSAEHTELEVGSRR